ncbi:MAG: methyl-accepting chemotaxis protein [Bacteroidetes bacterium]|nr:MAG: methyl-accepting chemotaxis protein [Bacteroidota bacterium]
MKQFISRMSLQSKILVPIILVSMVATIALYNYIYATIFDAKIEEHVAEARALIITAESAREYAADQYNLGIFKEDLKTKEQVLHTVPVLAAMKVIAKKADEMGVKFKVPKFQPRNPKNEPDTYEADVLRKLEAGNVPEFWEFSEQSKEIRYFRPVKLTRDCMMCHGDPATSKELWGNSDGKDITGGSMENWKEGEVHGAFEIRTDLTHAVSEVQTASMWAAMIVFLAGLAVVAVAIFIARWFTAPIKELAAQSESIAQGDLRYVHTPALDRRSENGDEMGQLVRSYGVMVNSLRDIIRKVGESSGAVASASTEISASTEQMAAGAHQQTSQASEVASAVEEMTKTIVENSQTAKHTAETSKQAKIAAEQGGKVVEDTVNGMKKIADVVRSSATTVQALGRSSDQIGEIISVIEEIADQTNLLALNAAIEAARAGEQGRGFAVVADEVRKLAERTTKATKEIASMIKQIQTDTKGAVTAMQEGTKQVDAGIALADRAGVSLQEIVAISQKVTDMISQIAGASEEQSKASELIAKNVEGISIVTQETANGAQQIAHTAEDLSKLTEHLEEIVGRFQLTDEDGTKKEHHHVRRASGPARSQTVVTEDGQMLGRR